MELIIGGGDGECVIKIIITINRKEWFKYENKLRDQMIKQ